MEFTAHPGKFPLAEMETYFSRANRMELSQNSFSKPTWRTWFNQSILDRKFWDKFSQQKKINIFNTLKHSRNSRGFKSEYRWNLFFNAKVFAANSTAWHLRIAERWMTTTFKTSFPLCFSCSRRLPKVKREKARKNFQFRRSMSPDNGWQMGRTEEEENKVGEGQTKKIAKVFPGPSFFKVWNDDFSNVTGVVWPGSIGKPGDIP